MSLASLNESHEISITAYNESEATRVEGGIVERTKSTEVTLNILKMHNYSVEKRNERGQRYREDIFTFQIRAEELSAKSFTLYEGRTHFIYNGYNYRVIQVIDYSMYPLTNAIQGRAVRKINVNGS
jgi:hypothetical protein